MTDRIIKIENLKKRYPNSKEFALKGIDLAINQGEFFGLLGPNGCGKTTLISILSGQLKANSGSIEVDGYKVPRQLKKIKPIIGLVPQDIALYATLTLKENLTYFGRLYGMRGKVLRERIPQCMKIAKLENQAKTQIKYFSGGMKRRANLAVSLLHQPKVLFLDEATVNVDPQSRHVIFDILNTLNANGTTLVYTTHYLEEAQQLCSRIAIVDHGKVIANGTPQELINNQHGCDDLGQVFLHLTGRQLRD